MNKAGGNRGVASRNSAGQSDYLPCVGAWLVSPFGRRNRRISTQSLQTGEAANIWPTNIPIQTLPGVGRTFSGRPQNRHGLNFDLRFRLLLMTRYSTGRRFCFPQCTSGTILIDDQLPL